MMCHLCRAVAQFSYGFAAHEPNPLDRSGGRGPDWEYLVVGACCCRSHAASRMAWLTVGGMWLA